MPENLYSIFRKCLPDYSVSKQTFEDILQPQDAHVIYAQIQNKIIGYSIIHGNSISLLCVSPEQRNLGFGSFLLNASEEYIAQSGAREIILGRGPNYLFQGVPCALSEALSFFKSRGYQANWTSANMHLILDTYNRATTSIYDTFNFRFAKPKDIADLCVAVKQVDLDWLEIFKANRDPVLLAMEKEKIVGFEILSPQGGLFNSPKQNIGSIGCVGVLSDYRNRGIGREMVMQGATWLKEQGCTAVELRYVALVQWYSKMGFTVSDRQWMGEKQIL